MMGFPMLVRLCLYIETTPSNFNADSSFRNDSALCIIENCCDIIWRERMGVCEMTVKRTRLRYWIARPPKPGVQSNNTSRVRSTVISHTPMCSRFYHTHIMYKRN